LLATRGLDRPEQDRADEEAAQDEKQIHPEEDRQRRRDEASVERDALLAGEDPRHVELHDGEDGDHAQPVQVRVTVVEQLEGEEAREGALARLVAGRRTGARVVRHRPRQLTRLFSFDALRRDTRAFLRHRLAQTRTRAATENPRRAAALRGGACYLRNEE